MAVCTAFAKFTIHRRLRPHVKGRNTISLPYKRDGVLVIRDKGLPLSQLNDVQGLAVTLIYASVSRTWRATDCATLLNGGCEQLTHPQVAGQLPTDCHKFRLRH